MGLVLEPLVHRELNHDRAFDIDWLSTLKDRFVVLADLRRDRPAVGLTRSLPINRRCHIVARLAKVGLGSPQCDLLLLVGVSLRPDFDDQFRQHEVPASRAARTTARQTRVGQCLEPEPVDSLQLCFNQHVIGHEVRVRPADEDGVVGLGFNLGIVAGLHRTGRERRPGSGTHRLLHIPCGESPRNSGVVIGVCLFCGGQLGGVLGVGLLFSVFHDCPMSIVSRLRCGDLLLPHHLASGRRRLDLLGVGLELGNQLLVVGGECLQLLDRSGDLRGPGGPIEDTHEDLVDQFRIIGLRNDDLGETVSCLRESFTDCWSAHQCHDSPELHRRGAFAFTGTFTHGTPRGCEKAIRQVCTRIGNRRSPGSLRQSGDVGL